MDKGAEFIATRIGQDALVIADLLQQNERLQARVDELVKKYEPPTDDDKIVEHHESLDLEPRLMPQQK